MTSYDHKGFEYDPFAKAVMENPLPFYQILRDEHPVYYIAKYDAFVVSRFADIVEFLSIYDNTFLGSESPLPTPEFLTGHHNEGAPPVPPITTPLTPLTGAAFGSPYYEDLRKASLKPLRPKNVQARVEAIRALANDLLDDLIPRGRFDLTQEYGGLVSASVVCDLFGIPVSEAAKVLALVNAATVSDPEKGGVEVAAIWDAVNETLIPAIKKRRHAGADGSLPLIDGLINFRLEGRPLEDFEIANQLIAIFVGGTETVPKVAAHGLMELARHPEQLEAVRSNLAVNVSIAVEEIIRYCAPAQWFSRTAHKPVTIAGQAIRPGQRVIALFGSAARDEREYENPDAFVWDRKIDRLLSFGFGQHHCVGLHVARAELRVLVEEFLRRVPSFSFDMASAVRHPSSFQWGWNNLPVIIG